MSMFNMHPLRSSLLALISIAALDADALPDEEDEAAASGRVYRERQQRSLGSQKLVADVGPTIRNLTRLKTKISVRALIADGFHIACDSSHNELSSPRVVTPPITRNEIFNRLFSRAWFVHYRNTSRTGLHFVLRCTEVRLRRPLSSGFQIRQGESRVLHAPTYGL